MDVTVTDNSPIVDLTTPPGFILVGSNIYPDINNLPASPDASTLMFQVLVPTQMDISAWQSLFNSIQGPASVAGYDLLGFVVWEKPSVNVSVPTQICFPGTSYCVDIPPTFCLPYGPCINLGGSTLVSGYVYQVWILVNQFSTSGYRGLVRAQLGIGGAIAIILLVIAGLSLAAGVFEVATGHLTFNQLQQSLQNLGTLPAQNIQQAEWPLILLGAAAIIAGVGIPALALGGQLNLPGGAGFGGNIGVGSQQKTPTPRSTPQRIVVNVPPSP